MQKHRQTPQNAKARGEQAGTKAVQGKQRPSKERGDLHTKVQEDMQQITIEGIEKGSVNQAGVENLLNETGMDRLEMITPVT